MVQLCPLIFAAIVPAKHTPIQAEGLKEQAGQEVEYCGQAIKWCADAIDCKSSCEDGHYNTKCNFNDCYSFRYLNANCPETCKKAIEEKEEERAKEEKRVIDNLKKNKEERKLLEEKRAKKIRTETGKTSVDWESYRKEGASREEKRINRALTSGIVAKNTRENKRERTDRNQNENLPDCMDFGLKGKGIIQYKNLGKFYQDSEDKGKFQTSDGKEFLKKGDGRYEIIFNDNFKLVLLKTGDFAQIKSCSFESNNVMKYTVKKELTCYKANNEIIKDLLLDAHNCI